MAVTTDPTCLPVGSTWYLLIDRPPARPARRHVAIHLPDPRRGRLYTLRTWVEQGYKQVAQELGWADWQVRTNRAIRRH